MDVNPLRFSNIVNLTSSQLGRLENEWKKGSSVKKCLQMIRQIKKNYENAGGDYTS